jgi:hypothetical protein
VPELDKETVRRVLASIRTPTREMIEAGLFAMRHGSRDQMYDDANLEAAWQAMIDKALGHALRPQHRL